MKRGKRRALSYLVALALIYTNTSVLFANAIFKAVAGCVTNAKTMRLVSMRAMSTITCHKGMTKDVERARFVLDYNETWG